MTKSILSQIFVLTSLLSISLGCSNSVNTQLNSKPDLVITGATYEAAPPIETKPPQFIGSTSTIFKVRIRNIGNGILNRPFYVSLAYLEADIRDGHYPYSLFANQNSSAIKPGETVEVEIYGPSMGELRENHCKYVKLYIQTDGEKHIKDAHPRVEESNYENNALEIEFK